MKVLRGNRKNSGFVPSERGRERKRRRERIIHYLGPQKMCNFILILNLDP